MIAGAVMPFVVGVFTSLSTTTSGRDRIPIEVPLMIGAALLAYLVGQRYLPARIPAMPAFAAGLLVAVVTGQLGPLPTSFSLPSMELVRPAFSWEAIATATPVLVACSRCPRRSRR